MTGARIFSNWEILARAITHPRRYWQLHRDGGRVLTGWWFHNPYSNRKARR